MAPQTTSPQQRLSSPSSRSLFFLLLISLHLSLSAHLAHAYSITAPTANALWTTGQPALVGLVSTKKATATTTPTDNLLTVNLCTSTFLIGSCNTVATIADRLQLLIPFNSTATSVSLDITSWIVPMNIPPGSAYWVYASEGGTLFPDSASSSKFQIIAGNTTTVPPTTTTIAPTTTTTTSQLPTATPATCNDIQEQCVAQGRVFQNSTGSSPCSCGAPLIVPTILTSGGIRSLTFEGSSGSYVALTVLLLSMLALF
ncbi:hypothetical protein EMPS_09397 [Entomortierella parvispora]|uniref:Uncharacterized protein n=1 Tax=Entomortierella parvispora TaxID=205924 RepID=A0A9P3HI91_9FUNG|nr:hypothetical protein EMPS_09397 [Entomortierella parvispora]